MCVCFLLLFQAVFRASRKRSFKKRVAAWAELIDALAPKAELAPSPEFRGGGLPTGAPAWVPAATAEGNNGLACAAGNALGRLLGKVPGVGPRGAAAKRRRSETGPGCQKEPRGSPAASPAATNLVGRRVRRNFGEFGWHSGVVSGQPNRPFYRVR